MKMVILTTKNSRGQDVHFSISTEGAREAGILPDSRVRDRAHGVPVEDRRYKDRIMKRFRQQVGS